MDMKKILQALDGASTKPVEGSSDMKKFLRAVTEADLNQPVTSGSGAPVTSGTPAAPAAPQVDPKNWKVPSVEFLKKTYQHPANVIDGAFPSESDPERIGAWQPGTDFAELSMALDGSYYKSRQANPEFQAPKYKDDWDWVQRMLSTPEGKEYAIANWIGLADINDKSPEAEFNRAQHKEFEKQHNQRDMARPDGVYTPGWRYDPKLGMTPAQAELQKQAQPVAKENIGMSRFLSIVTESVGPLNRLTTAETIALNHYTAPETRKDITSKVLNVREGATPGMFGKYFKTVEQEFLESAERSKERARQLAERVIERVTIGPDGQVTGGFKPTPADPNAPAAPAAPAEPPATLPGKDLPKVDAANRDTQTVTIDGQEYEMVHLPEGGIRPRGGVKYKIPLAMLGIRSIGNLVGILVGGKVYVLPKGEQ